MRTGTTPTHETETPVMVVAANPATRDQLTGDLTSGGYSVVRAASADEALALLDERRPIAVVVCTKLPGTNWVVLAARARRAHGAKVVVLTRDDVWQRAKAHSLGCSVLQRPIDRNALLELLSERQTTASA